MDVFTIEPKGGWRGGDRAYCVRGTTACQPPLVEGRVYDVARASKQQGRVESGITIAGISLPLGADAFSSNRFICLRKGASALSQINARSSRSWMEAYAASCGTEFAGVQCRVRT